MTTTQVQEIIDKFGENGAIIFCGRISYLIDKNDAFGKWFVSYLFWDIERAFSAIKMDELTPIGTFPTRRDIRYKYLIHIQLAMYKLYRMNPLYINRGFIMCTVEQTLIHYKLLTHKNQSLYIIDNILNKYSL